MFEWTPLTVTPTHSKPLLLLRKFDDGGFNIEVGYYNSKLNHYTTPTAIYPADSKAIYGYMLAESIIDAPRGYDPNFGDDRLCKCGHPYYRHFDTYEGMSPVGCKYCHMWAEGVSHRVECFPKDFDWEHSTHEDHEKYASICTGFELAEGQ